MSSSPRDTCKIIFETMPEMGKVSVMNALNVMILDCMAQSNRIGHRGLAAYLYHFLLLLMVC